jgi:hypothetical protein
MVESRLKQPANMPQAIVPQPLATISEKIAGFSTPDDWTVWQ